MKILILKPSSLGDVIHAMPVLRLLRKHLPHADIYWWIDSALVSLLEDDPDLTGVVRFERKRWASPIHWPELFHSLRWARGQRFDWIIDLQCLARSGVYGWLANGKLFVGMDEPREGATMYYDLMVPPMKPNMHAVDWYLTVLPLLGVPVDRDFVWLPERPKAAASIRARWHPEGSRWIALQPGARWDNKRWPAEHFAALVKKLAADAADTRFAILGGGSDKPLAKAIVQAMPERCLDLTGETTLPEMIEWLRLCELMVTNDTGPAHVAAALGKPVISLFGPTNPTRTGPYGQIQHALHYPLPCAPCMKSRCTWRQPLECLTAISPTQVAAKVHSLLPPRSLQLA